MWLGGVVSGGEKQHVKDCEAMRERMMMDMSDREAKEEIISLIRVAGEEGGSGYLVDKLHEIGGLFKSSSDD